MAENISAELAYLHSFEDIKAIVFPLEEFGLLEEDIFFFFFCELFSILSRLHKTCNESVYEQLHESNPGKRVLLIEIQRLL